MVTATRSGSTDRRSTVDGKPKPQRLILCFDGTGNSFQGNPGDTNVVKLFNMFERTNPDQMHYYQPGIGTYPAEGPVNVGIFRTLLRKIEATIDMGLATSFDSHVIAGYRFLMRYYNEGDRVYIFGFSRGSFTARFLARMVSHIGLLSRGNDEMVPFAYKVYQEYEQNRGSETSKEREVFMNSFKYHFCRTERDAALRNDEHISPNESGVKVHFLGLFDCVNSVGTLDVPFWGKTPPLPAVRGTAKFVRHAVAIDERRVKFKAALFAQEREEDRGEDIKEVWFPGNHGDIGGGWSLDKTAGATKDLRDDYFQMSDIALKWMIDEIDDVEKLEKDANQRLAWEPRRKVDFLKRFAQHKEEMRKAKMHDTMTRNGGAPTTGWFKVLFWNWMEYFPLIKRWEFVEDTSKKGGWKWDYILFPLNRGGRRDIPNTALFHHAVINRMRDDPKYMPDNHMWVRNSRDFSRPVKSDDDITKKNLVDVANQYKGPQANGFAKDTPVLVHDPELSKGSVAVEGPHRIEAEKEDEWNNIYRVEFA